MEKAVPVYHFGGCFGVFVIPLHGVIPFVAHLALYAYGTFFACFRIDHFYFRKLEITAHCVAAVSYTHLMYNTAEILLLGCNIDDDELLEAKAKVDCHDTVNMQYTSGTTGFPKGVMLTHYNISNNGFLTGEHMKFTSDDKLCVCVPLFHCFGVVLATMNCLTHGCTQVMVERFDPLLVLASVHKERCTALYGVPTMFIAELNHPMFDMFDMSSLRTGIMAGSLCPVELMKRVEEKMFMKVTSVYGLSLIHI